MKYARSYRGGTKGGQKTKNNANKGKGIGRVFFAYALAAMLVVQAAVPVMPAIADAGSIWTTDENCVQQDKNSYAIGDDVWIRGAGFDPSTSYAWSITGQPGNASADPNQVVASGNEETDANGGVCFLAYTVAADDDGVYNVDFDNKGDNYSVDGQEEEVDPCEQDPTAEGCEEDPCLEDPTAEGCEVDPCEQDPTAEGCEEDPCLEDPTAEGCNEPEDAVTIEALKVVCLDEADLPNWGDDGDQDGEPAMITASTATDFVAASNERCWLEEDWSFQWGFAEKDGQSGVHKLPGDLIGEADGTPTTGACPDTYCGTNTNTGTGYADWKTFDSMTSSNGTIPATVEITDLEGAPGVWVRENLQEGYVPFTYPPMGATESNVSAEIYCHTDIQNYDNYDQVSSPELGNTYNCVAFNALKGATIEALKVVCLDEADLPNWGNDGDQDGEPAMITSTTATDFVAASNERCWLEEDWSFQWGFAEKADQSGVHKLPGDFIGEADGTDTSGACPPTFCGTNTYTGDGYADWKNFTTMTAGSDGAVAAVVVINDLEGAPGVWVRENLQEGYVPFTYPPLGATESNVSAEIYCHGDIQNYDNYDQVSGAEVGETYYCVAFNALEDGGNGEPGECVEEDVLANGSFELPLITDASNWQLFDDSEAGMGWSVEWAPSGSGADPALLEYQHANLFAGSSAADGNQYAEMDSTSNVSITQDIATEAGRDYTLTFSYSPRPGQSAATQVLEVYWDGGLVATVSEDGGDATAWTEHVHTVTGTGGVVTLEFREAGTADAYGSLLDKISLVPVCEEDGDGDGDGEEEETPNGGSSSSSGTRLSTTSTTGQVQGESTDNGQGGTGEQPTVLGETLPRTGMNAWMLAPLLASVYILTGLRRAKRA